MARTTLTGSRIRERRGMMGMRQADLARNAGISASYLNLIEHNRRRIGGKLLLDIAAILGVEPAQLSEGAEAALTASLREAASSALGGQGEARAPMAQVEVERVEEFAGRFPGWAHLLAAQQARIQDLEQAVEALSDRLTHDPHLAASLHEVLSTVTAIRSAATILVETKELEPEWRDRFHRNIFEDSARLAEGAQRLVDELDQDQRDTANPVSPQEEVQGFLDAAGHDFAGFEAVAGDDPGAATPKDWPREAAKDLLRGASFTSNVAGRLAEDWLDRMARDAQQLPAAKLSSALGARARAMLRDVIDPFVLAADLGVDAALVMRRLAAVSPDRLGGHLAQSPGLVICDASGTLLYRRPVDGFPLPRFGAACPLWPLFSALSRPMFPIRQALRMAGRNEGSFVTFAVAQPDIAPQPGQDAILRSHMLIWPQVAGGEADATGRGKSASRGEMPPRVGVTCRVCPRMSCPARREPSIMGDGA